MGTAELLEALEAVSAAGLADPAVFKAALKATLVKKPADFEVFNRTFDKYFIPPEEKEKELECGRECEEKYKDSLSVAEEELNFMGEQLTLEEEEKVVFASLPDKERDRIKQFVEETEQGKKVGQAFKPVLEAIVKGSLRYWRSRNGEPVKRPPSVTGDPGWDWMLSGNGEGGSGSGESALKDIDMSLIAEKDVPEAAELIRKMSHRLAGSLSRRYRMSKKRKELDLRRTIRDNISYGGYFYHLRYRRPGRNKLRLLLLCDVSGSMVRYTGFILPFIYGLNTVISDIESFVFAENLERITGYMERGVAFEETMKELMRRNRQWGGGTRIDVALDRLMRDYAEVLTPKTIVIIVSDTKTTSLAKSLSGINDLRFRVKDIIWLNTLPVADWDRFRSVQTFREVTQMHPCNRLADLEQVFEKKII